MRTIALVVAIAGGSLVTQARAAAAQEYLEDTAEDGDGVDVFIAIDAEFFAGGAYTHTRQADETRFEVERGEVGTRLDYGEQASAELRLETARSVPPPDAEMGDEGALTVRAKRAWVSWREKPKRRPRFEVRGGLIPDPWIDAIEGQYELRGLAPTAAEHAGLIDHSDLGLSAVASWKQLRAEIAVTNGEGRARPERNRDKNTSAILSFRMPKLPGDLIVAAHVFGRGGSVGADPVQSHRLGTAMTFDGPRFGAGAELVNGWGVGDRADVAAMAGGIWGYATLKGRTGVAARVDWTHTIDDTDLEGNARTATLSIWHDLVPRGDSRMRDFGVRAYLAAQRDSVGAMAPALSGPATIDATRVMIILQASARETVE
jgi:hypothetical protein